VRLRPAAGAAQREGKDAVPARLRGATSALWGTVRQWMYPPEFRIAPSAWPSELLEAMERLTHAATPETADRTTPPDPATEKQQLRLLADVGTGLWRLRQKMQQPGTNRPLEEMRRAYRHLESVWDVLAEAGVEIQDHTDAPFDPGMSLRVIAYQPTAGIDRERVIETIKPTIYVRKQAIQMGEVIVATPENTASQA
jgi:hypothetical protein